tara:strand:- start:1375 stop:1677 length:303 start_codon:yes stop_codon:yes gene_type:complete
MQEIVKLSILNSVKNNSNLTTLLRLGLVYSQISHCIIELSKEGYLITEEGVLKLTPKGLETLDRLNAKFGPAKGILPDKYSRIKKIGKNKIYVPLKPLKK